MTCCISCHLNTPFHMVIDHPIIMIPEYVLGRSGSWAQHTCQWYRGSLIHMILFSTLDVGLRIDNIEMNSSWNCPSWSWHLTLIDSSVSVLDKLYLQKNLVLIEYIPNVCFNTCRTQLKDPSLYKTLNLSSVVNLTRPFVRICQSLILTQEIYINIK